jgi:predicted nucleic acid-binding protein
VKAESAPGTTQSICAEHVCKLGAHRAGRFLADLAALPAERYSHTPLIRRMWDLRHNFTAYDAAYIALAEATDSVLCTSDEKLAGGHRAKVLLFTC